MSRAQRILTTVVACFVLLSGIPGVQAEIAARLDREGDYLFTEVVPSGSGLWTKVRKTRASSSYVLLNPYGDRKGDLPPLVKENSQAPYHPWVVWSRPDGDSYRLVYSRWKHDRWTEVNWVESSPGPESQIGPALTFNPSGRPFLVWQSKDRDSSKVLLSVWLSTRWSDPILVSQPGLDAWDARVEAMSKWHIAVKYQTAEGTYTDLLTFDWPVTITDDINPQALISVHEVDVPTP